MRATAAWAVLYVCLTMASSASAQICEEDAATACVDDAGTDDAGIDGVSRDGGAISGGLATCSCTSDYRTEDGYLHICTGSLDEDTCAELTCEQGIRASSACSQRSARMCCEMPDRRLYTQLYDDCTHPRCELGFRAQCEDFGGRVHLGPCDLPEEVASDDDGGFCSALPGQRNRSPWAAAALLALGLVFARRRR